VGDGLDYNMSSKISVISGLKRNFWDFEFINSVVLILITHLLTAYLILKKSDYFETDVVVNSFDC